MSSKYFLKGWSVTSETVSEVKRAAEILKARDSYALRVIVSLGLQQLEKQKEGV